MPSLKMDGDGLTEEHKQKGLEYLCTGIGFFGEYYAMKNSYVWLAWTASIFLGFAAWSFAGHYLRPRWPRFTNVAILAILSLIVAGTYWLTKEPKHSVNTAPISHPQVQVATNQTPQTLPGSNVPKTKAKLKSRPPHVKIELHGAGSGAVGGDLNVAPCSNSEVGGIDIHQTVNCEQLPPVLSVTVKKLKPNERVLGDHWSIGQSKTDLTLRKNPGVLVTLWLDRSSIDTRVAARCDQACAGIDATLPVPSSIGYGVYGEAIPLLQVGMLPKSGRVEWEIRSTTEQEINVAESDVRLIEN